MASTLIPESHIALVDGPYWAALTTVAPDGQPQTTPVWCSRDGSDILISTMQHCHKARNMQANPKVTLLIYDPRNPLHNIEIRGTVVEMTADGAEDHLDALTQLYSGNPDARFFGDQMPAELRATHQPVKVRIRPTRIRVED
ncbi:MAG: PPOX class F420-dependent oxidoreductase [Aggregatilineales bacterium]